MCIYICICTSYIMHYVGIPFVRLCSSGISYSSAFLFQPVWIEKSRGTMANFWIFHALLMHTFLGEPVAMT